MRRYLRARYLAPALIALVMIVYGSVTSVLNTRSNLAEFKEVEESMLVIEQVDRCLNSVLDLETSHRGYLITGQTYFLGLYRSAALSLDGKIEELGRLTEDQPAQQRRVGALREAAREKTDELARSVAEVEAGNPAAARSIVATGNGQRITDRFRDLIEEMRKEESLLLAKRQKALVRNFADTSTIVVVTGAVAIAAGVVGAILLTLFLMAKERQERLLFEREKAVQADRAKTDFLAMMSHEIRTPMNAILGFGELLHDMSEDPQEKHFAKAIITSGTSLLSLIDDILDLSKIEAQKMELHPEAVEMKRFAENLETLFAFRAHEKGLDFHVSLDPSIPAFLTFDALRLRQVLVNLIGNALKFTSGGHVHATLRAETDAASGAVTLHSKVEDTGIGIAGDQVGEIFRPFYQVEFQKGRRFPGTGLGLSISERLVDLMGGRMEVQSHLGKGSVFRVSIPVHHHRIDQIPELLLADTGKPVDFNRLAPATVLIVDDLPLNRELIRGYLHGTHHRVLEAENGEQAVILCRRHLPDIVLMDIRMPVVDGPSAREMLKSQETTRKIPLIAVTASSLLNSQEELKRLFDGFASKPISRERLYLELARFLPVQATAATGKPVPEEPVPEISHAREWPELKTELETLRDSALPGLIELVPAQATLRFARQLAELARTHDCPPLAEHAAQLERAASNMDFPEAGRLLAVFPGLIDSLA